jgi:hypothetical protein
LSISRRIDLVLACAVALAGCGDKVPQSAAAQKVGGQPRQIIDKVSGDTAKAMQQATERQQNAEKKE